MGQRVWQRRKRLGRRRRVSILEPAEKVLNRLQVIAVIAEVVVRALRREEGARQPVRFTHVPQHLRVPKRDHLIRRSVYDEHLALHDS